MPTTDHEPTLRDIIADITAVTGAIEVAQAGIVRAWWASLDGHCGCVYVVPHDSGVIAELLEMRGFTIRNCTAMPRVGMLDVSVTWRKYLDPGRRIPTDGIAATSYVTDAITRTGVKISHVSWDNAGISNVAVLSVHTIGRIGVETVTALEPVFSQSPGGILFCSRNENFPLRVEITEETEQPWHTA